MFFHRSGDRGTRSFSSVFIFSSFFGALFIAGALAYNDYRFSKFNIVNFEEFVFYTSSDIFTPNEDKYQVVVFSSNMRDFRDSLSKVDTDYKILAVDMYQNRKIESSTDILYVSSGISTLVKFIQRMNIYEIPVTFEIERFRGKTYKQSSKIESI